MIDFFAEWGGYSNYPFNKFIQFLEVSKIKIIYLNALSILIFEKVNEIQGLTCILGCTAT